MRHGLVSSHRGTGGGFDLNVTPESFTLLQVVEAIEGKIALNICLSEWQSCPLQRQCAVHPVWQRAQAALSQELAAVTIAEFGGADKREIELSDGRSTVRRPRHAVNAVRLYLGTPVC